VFDPARSVNRCKPAGDAGARDITQIMVNQVLTGGAGAAASVLRAARAYEQAHPFAMPQGYV
jgi:hypothetical protein